MSVHTPTEVHVAVGLIVQNDHALIAWRDGSRHQGNRYEFAGGKVDAGETAQAALVRELREELGIEVTHSRFLHTLRHQYADKLVCLHVFYVDAFDGQPVGQEGQPVHWVPVNTLADLTFPDANAPIVRAAQLPCHYIVTPELAHTDEPSDWLAQLVARVPQAAWLYVRVPSCTLAQQQALIMALHAARPDVRLIVSAALHASQSLDLPVIGYHLTQHQLMALDHLPRQHAQQYWFAACHDADALAHAGQLGVDALVVGNVQATSTHPQREGLGWPNFAQLIAARTRPVYALGGLSPADLPRAQAAGAWGVAGIRAFLTLD